MARCTCGIIECRFPCVVYLAAFSDRFEEGISRKFTDFGAAVDEGFGKQMHQFAIGTALHDADDIFAGGAFGVAHGFGQRPEKIAGMGEDHFLNFFVEPIEDADQDDPAGAAVAFQKDGGEFFLFGGRGIGDG